MITRWELSPLRREDYIMAQKTAEKARLVFISKHRENHSKWYHCKIMATTEDQSIVLAHIISACFSCPEQDFYKKKLLAWIRGEIKTLEDHT